MAHPPYLASLCFVLKLILLGFGMRIYCMCCVKFCLSLQTCQAVISVFASCRFKSLRTCVPLVKMHLPSPQVNLDDVGYELWTLFASVMHEVSSNRNRKPLHAKSYTISVILSLGQDIKISASAPG